MINLKLLNFCLKSPNFIIFFIESRNSVVFYGFTYLIFILAPMKIVHSRYSSRPVFMHVYMIFLYLLPLAVIIPYQKPYIIALSLLFGLAFLSTFWNVKILILQCYSKKKDGEFILFENTLSKIEKETISLKNETEKKRLKKDDDLSGFITIETFICNRKKYYLDDNRVFLLESSENYTLSQLMNGFSINNYEIFTLNEVKVPHPSFFVLFKEQCATPLFCFQIFSSLLMCFDDHILNSLFSTAMIIFVEASLVFSRVMTMKIFRKLENKSSNICRIFKGNGKRLETKEQISSTSLKPGDKIIIDSLIDVPCDMVILAGSCAVNESMLSGESVPLFKEEIIVKDEMLSFQHHRSNVLFSGTKLEKIYSPLTCIILRTGYSTEQGRLISKMLQSEDIKYDPESFKFIILLTIISFLNIFVTYKYSSKTGYALFLDLIILFTNSIPFELPMELGMSVQSAVKNLMGHKIYCLEPYRITLAGKVDVCCFDKTGTLTNTKLEVKSIEHSNEFTNKILSCCHNLILVDGEIKGDPLELAIYKFNFGKFEYKLLKLFSFSSELKRQGVVVELNNQLLFCMKGAPEIIEKYLYKAPLDYSEYKEYAKQGYRVISLAYKIINRNDLKLMENRISDREYFENDLIFSGFILLGSSLKDYAIDMCKILEQANIKSIMITGDNILTAINVGSQLKMHGKAAEGQEIDSVVNSSDFLKYRIFGRADPRHKELIIKKYQSLGYHTMMVGDGTNDV